MSGRVKARQAGERSQGRGAARRIDTVIEQPRLWILGSMHTAACSGRGLEATEAAAAECPPVRTCRTDTQQLAVSIPATSTHAAHTHARTQVNQSTPIWAAQGGERGSGRARFKQAREPLLGEAAPRVLDSDLEQATLGDEPRGERHAALRRRVDGVRRAVGARGLLRHRRELQGIEREKNSETPSTDGEP